MFVSHFDKFRLNKKLRLLIFFKVFFVPNKKTPIG